MPNPLTIEKLKLYIFYAFRGLLIITAVFALAHFHWREATFLGFTLFLTFLPQIVEGKTGIDYPGELEILILLFIIGSIYLGEMHAYYDKFPWWDTLLHSFSGIIIGGIGFSVVFILNKSKRVGFKLSPVLSACSRSVSRWPSVYCGKYLNLPWTKPLVSTCKDQAWWTRWAI